MQISREFWLLTAVVVFTVVVSLGLIRWFAPQLLGLPVDLRAVQVAETLPPFFDGALRLEDLHSDEFLINDPYSGVRGKPLYPEQPSLGPHDLLGFRNRSVPNVVDVLVIGDSQTYGNNAPLDNNWPNQLKNELTSPKLRIYNASVGGWAAVQYLYAFSKLIVLQPKVTIIAFYSGNDPWETFALAYSSEKWAGLRLDRHVDEKDKPYFPGFPPPEDEIWQVRFKDGTTTSFTPSLRLTSNNNSHSVVNAGYEIMGNVAHEIMKSEMARNTSVIFTIIPTKELSYAKKVLVENKAAPEQYLKLIKMEAENIQGLVARLNSLPNAKYVDIIKPLQEAALGSNAIYPTDSNGHPVDAGYKVIAQALAKSVSERLPPPLEEVIAVKISDNTYKVYLNRNDGLWLFSSQELLHKNGWSGDKIPVKTPRDISGYPIRGTITTVDQTLYGPSVNQD